jgi:hypothetical protein
MQAKEVQVLNKLQPISSNNGVRAHIHITLVFTGTVLAYVWRLWTIISVNSLIYFVHSTWSAGMFMGHWYRRLDPLLTH